MVPLAKFDISLKNTPPVWHHFVQKVGRGFLNLVPRLFPLVEERPWLELVT